MVFIIKSSTFKEENGHLTHVEVDEVLGFVGDVRSEVSANDAMPSWVIFFVEFLFNEGLELFKRGNLLRRYPSRY